jgi:hypothetical protein
MLRVLQVVLLALIVSAICLMIVVIAATPLRAHSWYDHDCCNTTDCFPVADAVVTATPNGWLVRIKPGDHPLAFKESTFLVPYTNDKVRMSQDEKFHVCLGKHTNTLFCIYVPGTGA